MAATRKTDAADSKIAVFWTPEGGDRIDLSPYLMSFDPGEDGTYETNTAFSDKLGTSQKIREMVAPKGKMAYREGTGGATVRAQCRQGQQGTLEWGWLGGAAGSDKFGILAEIKMFKPSGSIGKLTEIQIEWVNQGSDWVYHPGLGDFY